MAMALKILQACPGNCVFTNLDARGNPQAMPVAGTRHPENPFNKRYGVTPGVPACRCHCFVVVQRTDKKTGAVISETAHPADRNDKDAVSEGMMEKLRKENPESSFDIAAKCLKTIDGRPLNVKGEPVWEKATKGG
jgi:hypothetical protein